MFTANVGARVSLSKPANDQGTLRLTELQCRVAAQRAQGKTHRQISTELGVSVQAIKKILARMRKRAVAHRPALERYAKAMSKTGKRVRFRAFSLLAGDCD